MSSAGAGTPARRLALRGRLTYPALLALGAIDGAAYSVIAPVTPEIAEAEGVGPGVIGVLVAAFPLAAIGGFVVAARSVARGRTRLVLVVSLATLGVGSLGFVLGDGLVAYFAARALMGLGSGGLWIGVVFSTLERWPGQEYLCMSRVLAAYAAGSLLGPALGAIGGIRAPFLAYLALVLLGLGLTGLLTGPARKRAFTSDRAVFRAGSFWLASAGALFVYVGYGVVEGILPLHLATELSQAAIGLSLVGMSFLVVVASALAGRYRPRPMLVVSLALVVAGLAAVGGTELVPLWLVALAAVGLGLGAGATGSIGILLQAVSPERIVAAMVVWSQLAIAGYSVGPLAGGAVAEIFGFAAVGLVPLLAGTAVVALLLRGRRASVTPA